jgi:hypothetical protein
MADLATLYDVGRRSRGLGVGCKNLTGFSATSALTPTNSVLLYTRQDCRSDPEEYGLVIRSDKEVDLKTWRNKVRSAHCVARAN